VEVVKTTNELERVVTIIVANDKQMPRRDPLRPLMEVRRVDTKRSWGHIALYISRRQTAPCPGRGARTRCCLLLAEQLSLLVMLCVSACAV
jgi:hypothetical protein